MDSPFAFEWGVDQEGYELRRFKDEGFGSLGHFGSLAASYEPAPFSEYFVVVGRGGPMRYYRPLDEDGLWLRFAETCREPGGALQFANDFGGLRCLEEE